MFIKFRTVKPWSTKVTF